MRTFLLALFSLLAIASGTSAAGAADQPNTQQQQQQLAQQAQGVLKAQLLPLPRAGRERRGIDELRHRPRRSSSPARKSCPATRSSAGCFERVDDGTMPPPDEKPRPSAAEDRGAEEVDRGRCPAGHVAARTAIAQSDVYAAILADLETMDRRARRFQRYFTLTHLYNAGLSDEELQTYRNALAKLVNSLSWGSKIMNPVPVDANRTVLRIDLRWYVWDATIWNRILQEYPYGILDDTDARGRYRSARPRKMPVIRADWFVATASRAPLYYDVLQLPASLTELEKLIRVDAAEDIQQERVARVGFNGVGISRFNRDPRTARLRTGDVLADLRLRRTARESRRSHQRQPAAGSPQHLRVPARAGRTGRESRSSTPAAKRSSRCPTACTRTILVNADNTRLDKGPITIVSDPKRPDRAVEAGVSCMSCHVTRHSAEGRSDARPPRQEPEGVQTRARRTSFRRCTPARKRR